MLDLIPQSHKIVSEQIQCIAAKLLKPLSYILHNRAMCPAQLVSELELTLTE